jgi:hypothetical protein
MIPPRTRPGPGETGATAPSEPPSSNQDGAPNIIPRRWPALKMRFTVRTQCNDHFGVLAAKWRLEGSQAIEIRVRVAGRFCRIAYQMVAGRMAYRHPCSQKRDYILRKLIDFCMEHDIEIGRTMKVLDAAVAQLPGAEHREEGAALAAELDQLQKKRRPGPRSLAEILPEVLAK